jgi:hypothetical protein
MPVTGKWLFAILIIASLLGCRKHASQEQTPLEALTELARSKEPGDRWWAIKQLGNRAPKKTEAVPLLIEALADEDENVRYVATEGLSKFGKAAAEAVPKLTDLLRDPSAMVRSGAVLALKNMGEAAVPALPALSAVAQRDGSQEVRADANLAITTIKQVKHFQDLGAKSQ